jgi:hypothetical protein
MTRISSQRVRQALLVLGEPLNPDYVPDNISLFDENGVPIDLNAPPGSIPRGGTNGQILAKQSEADFDAQWFDLPTGGGGGGSPSPDAMIWCGDWDLVTDYYRCNVVQYDPGDGVHTYLFTQDSPAVGVNEELTDNVGHTVTNYWDPANTQLDVTLDATSYVADIFYNANSPYVAVGFKIITSGQVEILTAPQDGVWRDLIANWYRRNEAAGTWVFEQQNDESAGLGHPRIFRSDAANEYLLVLTTTDGADPSTQYGTSVITIGPNNTAEYGAFTLVDGTFPIDQVVRIG